MFKSPFKALWNLFAERTSLASKVPASENQQVVSKDVSDEQDSLDEALTKARADVTEMEASLLQDPLMERLFALNRAKDVVARLQACQQERLWAETQGLPRCW